MSALSDRVRAVVGHRSSVAGPRPSESRIPNPESHHDLSALGGEWRDEVFVVETRFEPEARYGRETVGAIADRIDAAAAHAAWFAGSSRRTADGADAAPAGPPFVFFDLETTGLSGGAGTQAFLVGCASFDETRAFVVRQFLLTRVDRERPMLDAVRSAIGGAGALVSFNGKSFDAPLLETRYLFHRLEWIGDRVAHVDVLHPARRFWNLDDCSLVSLERHVVGAPRTGDVPGLEIPSRYFQFLRSGDAHPLGAVLQHNRLDLLTLAALAARLLHLARVGPLEARTGREALALGHVLARVGMDAPAREAFERAVALCPAPAGAFDATRIEALRALALAWRRARRFERSADLWAQLLDVRGCPPAVAREATEALAIHHEHRARDLASAKAFALRTLDMAPAPDWIDAARHRIARIDRKIDAAAPRSLL